jgi:hypothetical protein
MTRIDELVSQAEKLTADEQRLLIARLMAQLPQDTSWIQALSGIAKDSDNLTDAQVREQYTAYLERKHNPPAKRDLRELRGKVKLCVGLEASRTT